MQVSDNYEMYGAINTWVFSGDQTKKLEEIVDEYKSEYKEYASYRRKYYYKQQGVPEDLVEPWQENYSGAEFDNGVVNRILSNFPWAEHDFARFRAYEFNKEIRRKHVKTISLDLKGITLTSKHQERSLKFFASKLFDLFNLLKTDRPEQVFEIVIDPSQQELKRLANLLMQKFKEKQGIEIVNENYRLIFRNIAQKPEKEQSFLTRIGEQIKKQIRGIKDSEGEQIKRVRRLPPPR